MFYMAFQTAGAELSGDAWKRAYLADLPRPVKAGLPEYKAIEASVERVIAEKLGLPFPMAPEVKAADQALLKHEVFSFFGAER